MDKLYYADTFHHVYNRGTMRADIFFDDEDCKCFVNRLSKFKSKYEIKIPCYCLLNNHFHLFVKQTRDDLTIGKFIGDLQNGYTKFINKKYHRTGVLFEGPAKSKFLSEKTQLEWIVEYIMLNPVSAGLVEKADNWKYSSAYEISNHKIDKITDVDELKTIFGSIENVEAKIKTLNICDDSNKQALF